MNPESINQESLLNRFVAFTELHTWRYRVAKVVGIERKKRVRVAKRQYKTKPAIKVLFPATKTKVLIPLESIVSVFLKRANNGTRKEIPIETWNEENPVEGKA